MFLNNERDKAHDSHEYFTILRERKSERDKDSGMNFYKIDDENKS